MLAALAAETAGASAHPSRLLVVRAYSALAGPNTSRLPLVCIADTMPARSMSAITLAPRLAAPRRQVKHVAGADQRFGARLVEDGARVDSRRHLESDARRNVGLDEAGDAIDRRSLRRQYQVDAGGTRLLRDARD